MEWHPLLQSLLPQTTTNAAAAATSPLSPATPQKPVVAAVKTHNLAIIFRLIFISFVGIIAILANNEASKGFSITIINDAGKQSFAGKRFSLFYDLNDKATRIVQNTSNFIENLLYPNQDFHPNKKQINVVTLNLAPADFPAIVAVDSPETHEFVILLSPSVIGNSTGDDVVVAAVLRGMARVWLWDGEGETPAKLLEGMVEYISSLAGFSLPERRSFGGGPAVLPENVVCWKDEDPRRVAAFLRYCDGRETQGGGGDGGGGGGVVVRRLNEGMRDGWHDGMMDDALGHDACASYNMMRIQHDEEASPFFQQDVGPIKLM